MKLAKFWIKEMKWAKRYYLNGVRTYLGYKMGWWGSPTLGFGGIRTFKDDIKIYKRGDQL